MNIKLTEAQMFMRLFHSFPAETSRNTPDPENKPEEVLLLVPWSETVHIWTDGVFSGIQIKAVYHKEKLN